MAGSIKGIIVEIGGDTSGLQKAISKVNSATSSLSKELKGINTLLKLDPSNTELLAQKQTVLTEAISETEDKLKLLRETQEKAVEAEANGIKISEENYRALQREIINTENKLKNLQLQNTKWTTIGKDIEAVGIKYENLGKQIDNLANKLTTRLTLPLLGAGVIGVKSAMEQEAAIQQVENIYGETADTIKEFAETQSVAYNMSSKEAYKYSQIYGNLIQSITDDTEENAKYTQDLLKASAVISSATGRTMEDVMDRIRSGLLGNTEAIEDLGVNVNVALLESTDAFKKFAGDKSWKELDFQTQQQIRLFGILEQTTKKYGDEVNENALANMQKFIAKSKNLGNNLSKKLLPIAEELIDEANELIDKFGELSDEEQQNIVKTGLMIAALGPFVKLIGTVTTTTGKAVKGIGLFSQAIGVVKTGAQSTNPTVNTLAKCISGIMSPAGLAVTALGTFAAIIAVVAKETKEAQEELNNSLSNVGSGMQDFITGIDTAEGYLDTFNSTLFASSEEQENLKTQMAEIQAGITQIAKTASDERRDYTQQEITQLEEYFTKLRELKDRELAIQQEIAGAITQQATTASEAFQGSLEEYQVLSQNWIKTAQIQADSQISIIQNRAIEEIALLNQLYGDKATMDNEEYAREYNAIEERKNNAITQAQSEVAEITSIYAQGYLDRAIQNDEFAIKIQEYNAKLEEEQKLHEKNLQTIADGGLAKRNGVWLTEKDENITHRAEMKQIWQDMYEDMNKSQEEQLGAWLAMLAQTEMYGGEIDEETLKMVDSVIASFDSMPKDSKEAMEDTMEGMLQGLQNKEPTLYARATSIATSVLSRLRKAFDIHSPSKETQEIFEYNVDGMIKGLDVRQKALLSKIDTLKNKVLSEMNFGNMELAGLGSKVNAQQSTIFTTPQITFNVQELDQERLDQCFNYINRKFGSKY